MESIGEYMESNQNRFGQRGFTGTSPSSTSMANYGNSAMTRGNFMRGLGLAGAGVAAGMMGMSGTARALPGDSYIEVYPSGSHPYVGLQGVLNAMGDIADGGTITLKAGTFDFGYDTVYVYKNVTIQGEGSLATNVIGGVMSFTVSGPVNPPINPTIQNIWFDANNFGPIVLMTCNGATIRNNKITNTIPMDIGFGGPMVYGIAATELTGGSITGTIRVEGNYLDLLGPSGGAYDAAFYDSEGIGLFCLSGAITLNVTNNEIHNPGNVGISLLSFPNGTGSVQGNKVYQRTYTYNPDVVGSGIMVGTDTLVNTAPGPTTIANNQVFDATGNGIWLGSQAANCSVNNNIITSNYIDFPNGAFGMFLSGVDGRGANHNVVQANTVSGSGIAGIMAYAYSHHNKIYNNNLSGFGGLAQVVTWGDSNNNEFTGNKYGGACGAGIWCMGSYTKFTNENFLGKYAGWSVADSNCLFSPDITSVGCILLMGPYNTITALKNGLAMQGFALCDQVLDLPGTNYIPGYNKCTAHDPVFIAAMQAKAAALSTKLAAKPGRSKHV